MIVAQVGSALDEAHARGVIHGDVKPQNVILDEQGRAFLTDFGLARPVGATGETLSRAGEFTGSADYIAPEQIKGGREDGRVDIYALGCVYYECLTGVRPYDGEGVAMRVLWAHLNEPPPVPSLLVADLDPGLDGVIARAMAKEPSERYETGGELGRDALELSDPAGRTATATSLPALSNGVPAAGDERAERAVIELAPVDQRPEVRIRLESRFRYVHHPLAREDEVVPLLGDLSALDQLRDRILHSQGGSFLVTGFRGVGKTTLIERALGALGPETDASEPVVHVRLNVARPRSIEELLFDVIRRCFECLKDQGLLARLSAEAQRELLLAYTRTSMSFNESRTDARERARSMSVSMPEPLRQLLSPSFELSDKQTEELATQAAFLSYSGSDAEHDFLRIVDLVSGQRAPAPALAPAPRRWRFWRRRDPPTPPAPWSGKLVVVFDELDKLTADEKGRACLDELFNGLKNLLVARGVHFLFVGGPELHDQALLASRRGNSVYDSVFAWQLYVPCVWTSTRELLDTIVERDGVGERDGGRERDGVGEREREVLDRQLETLARYLTFKGRGVPRLILTELNSLVRWEDGTPWLVLSEHDLARVEHYAQLERDIDEFMQEDTRPIATPIDYDRHRLTTYYLTDRILRMDKSAFTAEEIFGTSDSDAVDALLMPSKDQAEGLLAFLDGRILEGPSASTTYYGDLSQEAKVYRLSENEVRKQRELASVSERERADLSPIVPSAPGVDEGQSSWRQWFAGGLGTVIADRYELLSELDAGGVGRVYQARDSGSAEDVAIKIIDVPALAADKAVQDRVLRAAELGKTLSHENIARTHNAFVAEGQLVIVMDYVDGVPLTAVASQANIDMAGVLRIAMGLADALEYLHGAGIARIDLKPSRVMLDRDGRPILLELGLARREVPDTDTMLTSEGVVLGSPGYMAPEQIRGEAVDIRADIYALGVMLFELMAGRPARDPDAGPMAIMMRAINEDLDLTDVPVTAEMRAVLASCVARDPAARFATPADLRRALERTPEALGA